MVTTADTPLRRMRGLLGRAPLGAGQALHIRPCRSVHTLFMRMPLDVIFLDAEDRVCRVHTAVGPWRMAQGGPGSRSVLEMAAGEAARLGVAPGQRLVYSQ